MYGVIYLKDIIKPGIRVGKTYRMLEEAKELKEEGIMDYT